MPWCKRAFGLRREVFASVPEGDTVALSARRLHTALAGKVLTRSDLRVPRLATVDLRGRRVESVVARGKHLLIRVGADATLHTHYGMEGSWHLYRPGERWKGPDHQVRAILATQEVVAVGFRLKTLELLERTHEDDAVGHLGPDLLGPDWNARVAVDNIRAHPDRTLGDVLLDQTVLAGAGNVYRSEVLFLRGLHPLSTVSEVDDIEAVVALLKRLFEVNRDRGDQVTTGDTRPGRGRWVYGRLGEPCRRCGTPIERNYILGPAGQRMAYWCPSCQPAPVHSSEASEDDRTTAGQAE